MASSHDLLYRVVISRGSSATLNCLLCISCNFPADMPLWDITLNWNGKNTAQTSSTIRVHICVCFLIFIFLNFL